MVYEEHKRKRIEEHSHYSQQEYFLSTCSVPSPVLVATGNTKSSVPLASSGSSQLDGKAEHRSIIIILRIKDIMCEKCLVLQLPATCLLFFPDIFQSIKMFILIHKNVIL